MYFSASGSPSVRPWTPDRLPASSVLQRLDSFAYASAPIGGLPVVESSVGTAAVPRGQRCVLFDGVDDLAVTSTGQSLIASSMSFGAWVGRSNWATLGNACIMAKGVNAQWNFFFQSGAVILRVGMSPDISWSATGLSPGSHHFFATVSGTTGRIYVDGVEVASGTVASMPSANANQVSLGSFTTGLFPLAGSMSDARIYGEALSASRVQAIFNQASTPTTIDRTGLLAAWWLNEESGTTHYDWSGNGRNLTATNVTQSTYHATDSGVRYNAANELGYTLSGSVVIPRNEATPSQDAAGGSLQFAGPIKLNATMEVPCITFSGIDHAVGPLNRQSGELTLACWFRPDSASGTQTLFSNIGDAGGSSLDYQLEFNRTAGRIGLLRNTSVVPGVQSASSLITGVWYHIAGVISGTAGNWTLQLYINGVLDATATVNSNASGNASSAITLGRAGAFNGAFLIGRMSAACLYSVAKNASEIQAIMRGAVDLNGVVGIWPIQAGPGSTNTNRTIHDASGNGNHLTVVGGTVATQWANRTNVVRDWCIEYGGSIAANGAFVPGRIGSSLDAAGNAKTIQPGTIGPYSRQNFNNWNAPSASLVNVPTAYREVPCVTGDGASVHVNIGTPLVPATADFDLSVRFFQSGSALGRVFSQFSSNQLSLIQNWTGSDLVAGRFSLNIPGGSIDNFAVADGWRVFRLTRVGSLFTMFVDGVSVGTATSSSPIEQVATILLANAGGSQASAGRIADFRITTGGVTRHYPLSDGSGRDVAWYGSDNTSGIISNAIVGGTLSNIWANRTSGLFDPSPYAFEAIVPRDTKINRTGRRYLATREPFTAVKNNVVSWATR